MQELKLSTINITRLERELQTQMDAYDDLSLRMSRQIRNDGLQVDLDEMSSRVRALQESVAAATQDSDRLREIIKQRDTSLVGYKSTIERLQSERSMVAKELVAFEKDLETQRVESQRFGQELRKLKVIQNETAERHERELGEMEADYRACKSRLQLAKGQLESAINKARELETWQANHHCAS